MTKKELMWGYVILFISSLLIRINAQAGCTVTAGIPGTPNTLDPMAISNLNQITGLLGNNIYTTNCVPCTATPATMACPKFNPNTPPTVDTMNGEFFHSNADIVNPLNPTKQLQDICRTCKAVPNILSNFNAQTNNELWRYCLSTNGDTMFLAPNATMPPHVKNKAQGTLWFNAATMGPTNVIFAIDARAWGAPIESKLSLAVITLMNALSPMDYVGVLAYSSANPNNPISTPFATATNDPNFSTFLLPWDSLTSCLFKQWANPKDPNIADFRITYSGNPANGDPTILLNAAVNRITTAMQGKPNQFSTCNAGTNIVFVTGQDLTAAQLVTMSQVTQRLTTNPPTPGGVNLWLVHPGAPTLTGNAQGSLLNTNLYTLQCFSKTKGIMIQADAAGLANVFAKYYGLYVNEGLPRQSLAYQDVFSQQNIISFVSTVNSIPPTNGLTDPVTKRLDYVCGIDVLTTAAPTFLATQLGVCVNVTANNPNTLQTTINNIIGNLANLKPMDPNQCHPRTVINNIDIDHMVRVNAPCVVTQTYWLDLAGRLRFNRVAELAVAVFLNLLWFILTWVHNPFCCCCCLDKSKSLQRVRRAFDEKAEPFISEEEKQRARAKAKALEIEGKKRDPPKDGKDGKAAVPQNTRNMSFSQSFMSKLSSSEEDEFFDPDSDQSDDFSSPKVSFKGQSTKK